MIFKLVIGWLVATVAILVLTVAVTETVDLLVGKNERDLSRSGRWLKRITRLADTLRGAWTLGLAWTFAVFLLVGVFEMHYTPTAADRWKLVQADCVMFGAWVFMEIVRAGVQARHDERIDMAIRCGK